MSLLQTLNDSNVQRLFMPLIIGVNIILCNWAINQLPALKDAHRGWRVLKLAIEAAILAVMATLGTEAINGILSSDPLVQGVGIDYFVVIVLVLCAMGDDVVRLIRKSVLSLGSSRFTLLRDRERARLQRQRQALIDKVRIKWVRGVLERSFAKTARIELELEEQQDLMLAGSFDTAPEGRRLPLGRRMFDEFTDPHEGGRLLILGEPGSGKTTQLLELARDLLDFTDAANLQQAVPVVLNLSSWGSRRGRDRKPVKTLNAWLIEELHVQYNLNREIAASWLEEENLTLLLDGLNEVPDVLRDECVAAINQFRCDHRLTDLVVCSRTADYEQLQTRLERFRKAVFVLPLEPQQIDDYLQEAGQSLEGVKIALQRDDELRAFASKPLFLSILSLAYRGISADELVHRPNPERLRRLFDRYLERVVARHPISWKNHQETQRFFNILAAQMGAGNVLFIDRRRPIDWLQQRQRQRFYRLSGGILGGLIVGMMVGWLIGLVFGFMFGLIFGLIFAFEK